MLDAIKQNKCFSKHKQKKIHGNDAGKGTGIFCCRVKIYRYF
jgi:hypothetical protein